MFSTHFEPVKKTRTGLGLERPSITDRLLEIKKKVEKPLRSPLIEKAGGCNRGRFVVLWKCGKWGVSAVWEGRGGRRQPGMKNG